MCVRVLPTKLLRARAHTHTHICPSTDTTVLPSVTLTFPQSNQGRPIPTENYWIVAALFSQSCDSTTSRFFFLLCRARRKKNSGDLCSEFSRKNVLLNALCLLTSLSCQFFCSAFVVAKDLCASSFVSDLRCQRCPFDVECRPHTRHHLCSSHGAPVDV